MKRIVLIAAIVCVAMGSLAETPWYKEPGVPMTLQSGEFQLHALLPRGWTVVDATIVPPDPRCRVEVQFHRDQKWNDFLVATLHPRGRRTVRKVAGHPGVAEQYTAEDDQVTKLYADLSGSVATLTLRERLPIDAGTCELQFLALAHSTTIER